MFYRRFILMALAATEFGCQKKAGGPPPRYAVVRFENLSGDPQFDWVGRAASEILTYSLSGAVEGTVINSSALGRLSGTLGGRPVGTPGLSGERTEALLAGANHLISGYITKSTAGVRLTAQDTDLQTGKVQRTLSVSDHQAFTAVNALARQFSDRAMPYLTAKEDIARAYFIGVEAPVSAAERSFREVVDAEPDFGPAWLTLTRVALAEGRREAAIDLIDQSRKHKLDPLTTANLDSEAAALKGDQTAKIDALRRIVSLSPGDTGLLRLVAETELAAGQFTAAAASWKKVTDAVPGDPGSWNSLGYARAYAADFTGALAALDEYRRLRPKDANPLDSVGDVRFLAGRYKEAAASYEAANSRDSNALHLGDLYKAAWAKYQAGDKGGAEATFQKYLTQREKQDEAIVPLIAAYWKYQTGRKQEAREQLRNAVEGSANPSLQSEGRTQMAVWALVAGERARAAKDVEAAGPPVGLAGAIVRICAMPSAGVEEWKERVARIIPDPKAETIRELALGYALLLDGKKAEAILAWKSVNDKQPATDFFGRAIYAKLTGKPAGQPLLPDAGAINQFMAILDSL